MRINGLGAQFAARAREVFRRISTTPRLHAIVVADVRKCLLKQFPYAIYYREEPDRVLVISVFHGSRDPMIWQARISQP